MARAFVLGALFPLGGGWDRGKDNSGDIGVSEEEAEEALLSSHFPTACAEMAGCHPCAPPCNSQMSLVER